MVFSPPIVWRMPSIPTPLPLEDSWHDVLNKAVQGTGIDEKNLAPSANIIPARLKAILAGELPSEDILRRLAIAVGLNPTPFLDLAYQRYAPAPFARAQWQGVEPIPTRYFDMIVNAYLIWDSITREAILFDTGTDVAAGEQILRENRLKLVALAITHTHGDHIATLEDWMTSYKPKLFAPKTEPVVGATLLEEGEKFRVGSLHVRTLLTDGHSIGHLTYVVEGGSNWPAPVAVVGDAIFAGSMGGGGISYSRLRNNVQTKILTLPPATLLCPGHGPLSTVEQENEHNPFA